MKDGCESCFTHTLAELVQRWSRYEVLLKKVVSIDAIISQPVIELAVGLKVSNICFVIGIYK